MHVEVRGQSSGVGSLLSCVDLGDSNSGGEAWPLVLSPTEQPHQPPNSLVSHFATVFLSHVYKMYVYVHTFLF